MHISIENSIFYEIPHREKSTEKIQFFLLVEKIKIIGEKMNIIKKID